MLDVEQRLLVGPVARDERVPRAVALAQHPEPAEQLERVGERLALLAPLEVDSQLQLGAERGDVRGQAADQHLGAAMVALQRGEGER